MSAITEGYSFVKYHSKEQHKNRRDTKLSKASGSVEEALGNVTPNSRRDGEARCQKSVSAPADSSHKGNAHENPARVFQRNVTRRLKTNVKEQRLRNSQNFVEETKGDCPRRDRNVV